jgi:hypothetical protein
MICGGDIVTKEELVTQLKNLSKINDVEQAHVLADRLLLEYINNTEVKEAFHKIEKWYT